MSEFTFQFIDQRQKKLMRLDKFQHLKPLQYCQPNMNLPH